MTEFDAAVAARLAEEIADLQKALDGTPAVLRDQGLFIGYESRLRQLQEELLSLRLASFLSKHQRGDKIEATGNALESRSAALLTDASRISLATEAVDLMRRKQHRVIVSYRYAFFLLGAAVVLGAMSFLAGVSILGAIDRLNTTAAGVALAVLAVGQLLVRQLEETKTQSEHNLALLSNQLEFLGSLYKSHQSPMPQVYERALKLLDQARIV